MIRSARIPTILRRITADNILQTAVLVTSDGELLGSTSQTFLSADGSLESMESLGTLIADIAVDYQRLGDEYALVDANNNNNNTSATSNNNNNNKKSHLQCLLIELDQGLVAVSSCVGVDCLVIGIATPNAPMGMIKARLQAVAEYVQESLSPLSEGIVYR